MITVGGDTPEHKEEDEFVDPYYPDDLESEGRETSSSHLRGHDDSDDVEVIEDGEHEV